MKRLCSLLGGNAYFMCESDAITGGGNPAPDEAENPEYIACAGLATDEVRHTKMCSLCGNDVWSCCLTGTLHSFIPCWLLKIKPVDLTVVVFWSGLHDC